MKGKFSIGEIASLFDITTETLRHYDRIDLVKPEINESNRYRYYDVRSLLKLSRILFLKNLEFSLSEIDTYMKNKNTNNLMKMLDEKEADIDLKIQLLQNLKNKIASKKELLKSVSSDHGEVNIKTIPKRKGIFLELNDLKDELEIKQAFKMSEPYLKFSSWLIEGQIYTSLSKIKMDKGIFNKFRYFIEIQTVDDKLSEQLQVLPKHSYACLIVIGPYEDMAKHYERLTKWIDDHGYVIAGDSIEKNIVDYDFADSESEYVSEIQIPVKKR